LQNIVTPQSNRITTFQISNPIKHQVNTLVDFCLKLLYTELLSDLQERWRVLGEMYDEENAEEVLRPTEEVWYQALMSRGW
jgi:hypothetical protein